MKFGRHGVKLGFMEFQTLIDVNSLRNLLDRPGVAVLDCRFDLMNRKRDGTPIREDIYPGRVMST